MGSLHIWKGTINAERYIQGLEQHMALFHCMVLYGSARLGTVRLSSGQFAFPLQFSTALEWAGLFPRRYNCAASTASDIIVNAPQTNSQQRKETE